MQREVREALAQLDAIRTQAAGLPAMLHHEIETKNKILEGITELKRTVLAMAKTQEGKEDA